MQIGKHINTYSGIKFYPLDPKIKDIQTEEIAQALSLLCRANGHFRHFYSVAQHSLNCAKEAKKRNLSKRVQLGCLLHDASEAYLSDVTRPVKSELPNYVMIEQRLQKMIYQAYGLTLTDTERQHIKEIDDAMLSYKLKELLHTEIESKTALVGTYDLSFVPMDKVKGQFIKKVDQLTKSVLPSQL